jgi:hypothetical protein
VPEWVAAGNKKPENLAFPAGKIDCDEIKLWRVTPIQRLDHRWAGEFRAQGSANVHAAWTLVSRFSG